MIGLDSNVVLRHLVQDDPVRSPQATAIFESRLTSTNPGYISTVVLVETAWVLQRTYRLTSMQVADVVEKLLQSPVLALEHESEVYEALSAVREEHGDFADALIGAVAAAGGCAVTLTFDEGALRLPGFEAA